MKFAAPASASCLQILAICLAVLGVFAGGHKPNDATAQDTQTIVAVVNEDAITSFDIDQRVKMLLLTSGLPNSPEQRQRLRPRVLQSLIDERLKVQEATRTGVSLTQEELDDAIKNLERTNRLESGGLPDFARRNNISPTALIDQLTADLTWQKLIAQTERNSIDIDTEQIDEVLDRIESSEGQTEYRLAEIVVLADERSGVSMEDADALAERLVAQLRNREAGFNSIATQFSGSASATNGGDIGWLLEAEMSPEMATAVKALSVNGISDPLREERGFRILGLIDRRLANTTTTDDTEVSLRALSLRLSENASRDQTLAKVEEAKKIRAEIGSCNEFKNRAAQLGAPQPASPTRLRMGDINPQLRSVISSLAAGQISDPLSSPIGIQLIMVCEREIVSDLPSRAEIRNNLIREKVNALSQRRLRDLRRAAFIDIRT